MKRRMLALLMALVMVMGILPILPVHVHAEEGTCTHEAGNRYYRLYQQDTRYHQEYCGDCNTFIRLGQHAFGDGNAYCSADGCGYINPNCAHRNHGDYYYSAEGCVADCLDCGKRTAPIAHIPDSDCYGNNGDGTHIIMCERCNSSYATESHTFSEGACTKCGAADADYVAPHVHSPRYDVGAAQHRVLCNGCSEVVEGWEDHVYVDGRCECGASEEYPEPPAHTHTEAQRNTDEGHETYCTGCSEVLSVVPHDFTNGDCSCGQPCPHQGEKTYTKLNSRMDNVRCDVCGDDLESVLHNMEYLDIGMGIHFGECTQCRDKDIEVMEPHTFENDKCIYCNVDRVVNCTHTEYEERYIKSYPGHNVKCTGCDTKLREEDHTRGICVPKADDAAKHYVCCADCKGEYALESHKFDDPAHMGVCECGVLCPHEAWNWTTNSDGTMHKQICLICGQDKTEFTAHVLNDPEHKGLCDCGVACVHPNKKYEQLDSDQDVYYHRESCEICDQVWEEVAHTQGQECRKHNTVDHYVLCKFCYDICDTAPHTFTNNGIEGYCSALGCLEPCPDCDDTTKRVFSAQGEFCIESCGTCGLVHDDETGHNYSGTNICTRCKNTCLHTTKTVAYKVDENDHNTKCFYCGYTVEWRIPHDFTNADGTCAAEGCDYVCSHDGKTNGEPWQKTTHTDTTHTRTCTHCNKILVNAEAHKWNTSGGCDYNGCTAQCKHETIVVSGTYDHLTHQKICSVCKQDSGWVKHNYENKDGICADGCGYECDHPEDKLEWTYAADGHTQTCTKCQKVIATADHNWNSESGYCRTGGCTVQCKHKDTKVPTRVGATRDKHAETCTVCQMVFDEDAQMKPHTWENDTCTDCGYVCNHEYTKTGWKHTETGHTISCGKCKWTESTVGHTFTDADCDICDYVCDHQNTSRELGEVVHDNTHSLKCAVCGKDSVDWESHNFSSGANPGTCECSRECTHNLVWTKDATTHYNKCDKDTCNYVASSGEHTYDVNQRTGKCIESNCTATHDCDATNSWHPLNASNPTIHAKGCDICGKRKNEYENHDFTSDPENPGRCLCGQPCPHTNAAWSESNGLHTQYCEDCKWAPVLDQPHDFKGATPGTCVCGEVCDHSSITEWGELDFNTKHTAVCPGCGETVTAFHTPVPGSVRPLAEGEKGQAEYVHHAECQVCGKSYNEAHNSSNGGKCTCGHCSHSTRTMTAWDANGHAMTCAVCGDVKTTAHIPEDFNDGVCKISGCEYKCPHSNMTYSEDKTTWSCPDCDMKDVPHIHEYVGEQVPGVYLNSHHRVKCVCGDAKSNLETHRYSGNVCTVCSYDKTATNP